MIRFSIVACFYLGIISPSYADDSAIATGSATTITSDAWTVTGFESAFELTPAGLGAEFRIASLALVETGQTFDDIRITCASVTLTTYTVRCAKATFTAAIPELGRQTIPGEVTYNHQTNTAELELASVAIANGRARFNIIASDAGLDARFTGTQLELGELLELAAKFNDALAGYSAAGLANIRGSFRAPTDQPVRAVIAATLSDTSLANNAGTIAADGVAGELDLDVTLRPDATRLSIGFESGQGEAYIEPVYANFSESTLSLRADDVTTPDFIAFDIPHVRVQQDALLDMEGSAKLRMATDDAPATEISADVELRNVSLANLYENLIKIAAAGTIFGNLETDGRLSGRVNILNSELQSATLRVDDAILDDNGGRFAIYGLGGAFDWSADEDHLPDASRLRWDSATAYNIVMDGASVKLQLGDNDVELLEPLRLPLLGGALLINQLVLSDFGSDDATGSLDAELEPVQLGQLTGAFGWPAFSGRLSGRLPLLQLAENTITVGGTLSARVFDGSMEMTGLRIEQPFGLVPRLHGELAFRNLDLQQVTEAFSFGLIQGRLSGDIAGLTLQNWSPVAMDMYFYTPANDKSQHRISQRAVENFASVGGGGAAAVLSTGFLKFFDVFSYDRIGLRCVLKDGVCAMSGAGEAKAGPQGRGYYLVKGSGVPRIDVVGYRNTVSWPRLMQQLSAITQGGTPTVN